jgi:hypothetical protein
MRSCRHPALSQGLPADQRTAEGQERLVDVSPLVIPHAEAPKLVQPRKRALDEPPPPPQATPVLRAAHSEQRQNVAGSQTMILSGHHHGNRYLRRHD